MAPDRTDRYGLRSHAATIASSTATSHFDLFSQNLIYAHTQYLNSKQSVLQSWDITLIDEEPSEAPLSSTPHSLHDGTDIDITYSIEDDEHAVLVDKYMQGSYEIYILNKSNDFIVVQPRRRFSIPTDGIPTFVRSSCLVKFNQYCNGSVVAISRNMEGTWTPIQLGIIDGIWYNNDSGSNKNCIKYYESNGSIDADGVPVVLKCKCWVDMKKHLTYRTLDLDSVKFHFINQVS